MKSPLDNSPMTKGLSPLVHRCIVLPFAHDIDIEPLTCFDTALIPPFFKATNIASVSTSRSASTLKCFSTVSLLLTTPL